MSLITDPLYLIHISRIKFLRMDERGERIITFPPTVMSDDYVRLAAPVYPEMQYCYSPVYDSYLNTNSDSNYNGGGKITSSPRTTKRNYRQRKPQQTTLNKSSNHPNMRYPTNYVTAGQGGRKNSTTDSEDDDIEVDKQTLLSNSGKPVETTDMTSLAVAATEDEDEQHEGTFANATTSVTTAAGGPSVAAAVSHSFHTTSLHPSVDSAIDPSPRSSIDDNGNSTFPPFPPPGGGGNTTSSIGTAVDISSIHDTAAVAVAVEEEEEEEEEEEKKNVQSQLQSQPPQQPLEYTKKIIPARPQQSKNKNPSALSALIAEKATAAENPFAEYSFVSGKGESKSITLCVYLPHSNVPYKPVSLVVRPDAITDDVIGYILYDYVEEKRQSELDEAAYDLAEWVLLIAEDDGEIEDGLPAVDRTRNIGRVSFDQFALCRATPSQAKQNDIDRARMGRSKPDLETLRKKKEAASANATTANSTNDATVTTSSSSVPATSIPNDVFDTSPTNATIAEDDMAQTFTTHLMSSQQQHQPDASTVAVPVPSSKATLTKATMPMTPLKYFRIKLMTSEEVSATTAIPVYAEMFIGDVLELVSRKRKLDPNEYMLTIADSKVIVPNDTTVESMKGITDLTLTKKGTALTIPSSSHLWRSPIKRKKDEVSHPMYFSTTESPSGPSTTNANDGLLSQYKKYTVSRKMPMFVSKRVYILAIDGDYIHLMPPEHKGMFDSVKTTSFHASAVKSCKQSKKVPTNFKIMILKERDFKTYDLEAENPKEANEICSRIRFLMQVTKGA